ncbi:hypothetical protein ACC691_38310, partial [Rhizobium johnstonii]|uniref:hypothetical protein n=1 Tax=Rhizobium johnstonii TaxID=3019933 RepID=UPI003F9D2529
MRAVIARGGMGTVFSAWDGVLRRLVAVKFLGSTESSDAAAIDREITIASHAHHPGFVEVFDAGEAPAAEWEPCSPRGTECCAGSSPS